MAEQDKGDKNKGIKTKPENRFREGKAMQPLRPKEAPRKPPPAKRKQSGKR
jgi:hypothetical protein